MVKEYKCPNCGGAVQFDSSSQNMKCPFCDAEFEMAKLEDYQKELAAIKGDTYTWDKETPADSWDSLEQDCLSTGSCPSCGAELIGDANTIATICPCCGNTQIVVKRLSGLLKPEFLIPFKLDKNAATDALKNFYKGKKLLPDCFQKGNKINEIQGVYLPFWLYDAETTGHIRYKATKTKSWSDSSYNYTQTDFYSITRDGTLGFEKVPVDGSERMDNNYMDAIEPFDYATLKEFQSAFLSGFLAEKYDMDSNQCMERAGKRMKASVETEFRKTVTGYSTVSVESSTIDVNGKKISYSLFPVWILNTKYNKENYLFLMNGQSGRLVGKLPVDKAKFWKFLLMYAGIIGGVCTVITQLLRIFL